MGVLPISASKLEAFNLCHLLYWFTYVDKPNVSKNAEFAFGDLMHRMLQSAYDLHYKSPQSFAAKYVQMWRDMQEIDFEKGKYGVWFPREDRKSGFYENYGKNVLVRFFEKNRKGIERIVDERSAVKERVKKEVVDEYLAQLPLCGKKITKREIHKNTKAAIKEKQDEELKRLPIKFEQSIKFYWKGFYLMTKPDFLSIKDDKAVYLDYKIYYDLMEHQFPMAFLGIMDKYKPSAIWLKMHHLITKEGLYTGNVDVTLDSHRFDNLLRDLHRLTAFKHDIDSALRISRSDSAHSSEREWAEKILDVRYFPNKKNHFCVICDFHTHCDSICSGKERKDLEMITQDYWDGVEDIFGELPR